MGSIIVVATGVGADNEKCYSTKYDGKIGNKIKTLQYLRPVHCYIEKKGKVK